MQILICLVRIGTLWPEFIFFETGFLTKRHRHRQPVSAMSKEEGVNAFFKNSNNSVQLNIGNRKKSWLTETGNRTETWSLKVVAEEK